MKGDKPSEKHPNLIAQVVAPCLVEFARAARIVGPDRAEIQRSRSNVRSMRSCVRFGHLLSRQGEKGKPLLNRLRALPRRDTFDIEIRALSGKAHTHTHTRTHSTHCVLTRLRFATRQPRYTSIPLRQRVRGSKRPGGLVERKEAKSDAQMFQAEQFELRERLKLTGVQLNSHLVHPAYTCPFRLYSLTAVSALVSSTVPPRSVETPRSTGRQGPLFGVTLGSDEERHTYRNAY